MTIDLRTVESSPEASRYAHGLAEGLQSVGTEVSVNSGIRPWWEATKPGVSIGVGAPTPSRRIDGWIWPSGAVEAGRAFRQKHPDWPLAIASLHPPAPDEIEVLPFPVPGAFYAPGDGENVFQVTRRLHLEQRPRVVMFGPFADGRGLSMTMTAMVHLLASGGELVVLDGISIRAQFAPVIQRLGLTGRVVFLPSLDDRDTAAVLLGADIAILPERVRTFPYWIPWCHAAGVPVVAVDTPAARLAVGTAALLVDSEREDGLENAIREVLTNAATHRQLLSRGMAQAERCRSSEVAKAFLQWIQSDRFKASGKLAAR